ncbi:MAG: nucleoside triphosphate pyrophosphohydrolase [Gemmatimonadota bacterium]|nr:nucleoside triphosphate pyrophosphohydrolase [Gemmatimonadota bacterium]
MTSESGLREEGDRAHHSSRNRIDDASLGRALALVRFLRDRCPWDAEQTPTTLRPYLLEEAHETADAIASGDEEALRKELGDLLLNVAFQIVLAEERGAFDSEAVVSALETKMIARHPHVYGDADEPPDWETMKAAEREAAEATSGQRETTAEHRTNPFDGLPRGVDPLSLAARVQERMAGIGFDWDDLEGPLAKVREEADELEQIADVTAKRRIGEAEAAVEDEIGDLLFAAVNAARIAGAHPANALLGAIGKFEQRSLAMLRLAEERGMDCRSVGLEALDRLWDEVKAADGA